mmetsp:Transcript_10649/g.29512  ORF Transcript_10649/g.29512 Transcript_10649/m.29512 type:complete len:202 (-) Transcript_10649:1860-2465(-)
MQHEGLNQELDSATPFHQSTPPFDEVRIESTDRVLTYETGLIHNAVMLQQECQSNTGRRCCKGRAHRHYSKLHPAEVIDGSVGVWLQVWLRHDPHKPGRSMQHLHETMLLRNTMRWRKAKVSSGTDVPSYSHKIRSPPGNLLQRAVLQPPLHEVNIVQVSVNWMLAKIINAHVQMSTLNVRQHAPPPSFGTTGHPQVVARR